MGRDRKSGIVKDAVRRFPNLPDRAIARFILDNHGDLFDNDLEKIRSRVRFYTGKKGKASRENAADKSLFKDEPVKLPPTWRKTRTPYQLKEGTWLVLSDAHIPFHEPKALEAAVSYGQTQKVTGVLINGDWQDCAAVSYWPTAKRDFDREMEAVTDSLDWLRQEFPKAEIIYKPGNHEYRLPRYYASKAPELASSPLAAMETLIGFEERDIEFLDYHQVVMLGILPVVHGHEFPFINRAVNPARGLFLRAKTWAACSHCHTTSAHTAKDLFGVLLATWSFGCLCDLSPDYNPFGNDWNHGFAVINVGSKGDFEVQNMRILPSGDVR